MSRVMAVQVRIDGESATRTKFRLGIKVDGEIVCDEWVEVGNLLNPSTDSIVEWVKGDIRKAIADSTTKTRATGIINTVNTRNWNLTLPDLEA